MKIVSIRKTLNFTQLEIEIRIKIIILLDKQNTDKTYNYV